MLKILDIENIAVIEKARIEFSSGFNVLTGETGAGKSIVVDSINAILGERTSRELVRSGSDYAFVSALFTEINPAVKAKLNDLGFSAEEDDSLLLTRRISRDGKSQCRINGHAATVSVLREVGGTLVNIHGQHDSQSLLNPEYHYQFIDMLSGGNMLLEQYKAAFSAFIHIRRRLKQLTAQAEKNDNSTELLDFQIKELEDADIKEGEIERLSTRKKALDSADEALAAYRSLLTVIAGDDENAGAQISLISAAKELERFTSFSEDTEKAYSLLQNIDDELETVKGLVENATQSLDFDPNEKERIEERLDFLYRLGKKYGSSEADMLKSLEEAKMQRTLIHTDEEELERLTQEYDSALDQVEELAEKLSDLRKTTALKFESDVKAQLEFLDMPKIRFIVDFEKGILSSTGTDKIEFLISTNPGEPPKPLAKIASGGELSRIMLAIKNIIAYNDTVDTLIFDEIDTGVSGRASGKIGLKLKEVSKNTQVITVTHSAQIAAFADEHFLIAKDFENGRTYTNVTPLDHEKRKYELARIMGGLHITDALLESAEEMLNNAQEDNTNGNL